MARLIMHGAVLLVILGSTHTAHAQADVPDDVTAVADEAGVDALDLLGAITTTHLAPRDYLCRVGELACPMPPLMGNVARANCIIAKESGGLDVPNRQGSGATGPGQFMPGTWVAYSNLYRQATGYLGPLSLHVLSDVRRVIAFMLDRYPSSRSAWAVTGC